MPRRPRFATGGHLFHVLNRAIGRQTIFASDGDYLAFERLLAETAERFSLRLLAYVVMPNHWHLVVWPVGDDDLSAAIQWLTLTHTARWHTAHETVGTGPLYQGRFKSFPIESDEHFYTVCRYVERNPLRANLVERAEAWRYSSLWQWHNERTDVPLAAWPLPRPSGWLEDVNAVQTEAELTALRSCVTRGVPFGRTAWRRATALQLGLPATPGVARPPTDVGGSPTGSGTFCHWRFSIQGKLPSGKRSPTPFARGTNRQGRWRSANAEPEAFGVRMHGILADSRYTVA